ncbi:hypothetical protein Taro_005039 [Colocasia esculenta]|uniref:Uncharacterized protein n=1 Tax=Colocasia esculenta TaxID=4460 RepID=A0A843TTF6_COLES|nr:hypothetical protein [Colocasia esculenta]
MKLALGDDRRDVQNTKYHLYKAEAIAGRRRWGLGHSITQIYGRPVKMFGRVFHIIDSIWGVLFQTQGFQRLPLRSSDSGHDEDRETDVFFLSFTDRAQTMRPLVTLTYEMT